MYILTDNTNNIIYISETLSYQSNGNPLVDNGQLAIAKDLVAHTYEKDEVDPKYNSSKYCYTEEQGFYQDLDWKPYYSVEDRVSALEDAVNAILEL